MSAARTFKIFPKVNPNEGRLRAPYADPAAAARSFIAIE
jgi:hypothetical protein